MRSGGDGVRRGGDGVRRGGERRGKERWRWETRANERRRGVRRGEE